MVTRILVVAEAWADWRMVAHLIDRKIIHHAPDWLRDDSESLDAHRVWCGLEAGTQFTQFSRLKNLAMDEHGSALRGAGPLGFSSPMPRGYEWASVRKVMILSLLGPGPIPDVIVYSRDMDQQPREREASIGHALSAMPDRPFKVVLALANPKREAWILNGFVAKNASEKKRLEALRDELGFDPCEKSEALTAAARGELKDAKRVLKALTADGPDREMECLRTSWEILRNRGERTGLTDFLSQVKDRIVPLVTGSPSLPH